MTSRTTPVGILIIALASLFAIGCSAQTSAVFEALLDSGGTSASAPDASARASNGGGGWWPHPDGYAMDLPAGWYGVGVDRSDTGQLIEAVDSSMPGLAQRMDSVLGSTASRLSSVAGDPSSAAPGPMLLVLAQPNGGRRPHEMKQHVKRQITQVEGVVGAPFLQDAGLPNARGWRFDYSIVDPDLGALRVRSYLFRYGPDAYLVSFVAPEHTADDADALFDAIASSLRFGV